MTAARDSVEPVHVVINRLRLRESVPDATVEAARVGGLTALLDDSPSYHLNLDDDRDVREV